MGVSDYRPQENQIINRHLGSSNYSKKDESFEGSEVIEELIEIEESGDEYSNGDNHSVTAVRTNMPAGRGSIGSVLDDNHSQYYYEEFKQNGNTYQGGGATSNNEVLS